MTHQHGNHTAEEEQIEAAFRRGITDPYAPGASDGRDGPVFLQAVTPHSVNGTGFRVGDFLYPTTAAASGCTDAPRMQVTAVASSAADTAAGGVTISTATNAGGAGYSVGNLLVMDSGYCSVKPIVVVLQSTPRKAASS